MFAVENLLDIRWIRCSKTKKKTNQFNDSLMVGLRFLYDVKKVHINAIMVVNYIPFHSMNVMVLILKQ